MKTKFLKRVSILLIAICILLVSTSCVRNETSMVIKRNGKAIITSEVLLTEEGVKEIFGMPTNFYDAVEKDSRFSKVLGWQREYVNYEKDGVNYQGVQIKKEVSKNDIETALYELYGTYATVHYSDKTVFGSRTISIEFDSNGTRVADEELQKVLSGEAISKLTITSPVAISSTTGNKINDNTVEIDLAGLLAGKEQNIKVEIKGFDFTFFIPIIVVVVVAAAAGIYVLIRVKRTKRQNEGLTSINLKNMRKKSGKGGAGGFGASNEMDDLDNFKPKSKMSFTKKTPRYDKTETNEAPVAPATPAAPAYEAPAAPQYEQSAPTYEQPSAPQYEQPAAQYEQPATQSYSQSIDYSQTTYGQRETQRYEQDVPTSYNAPTQSYSSTIESNSAIMSRKTTQEKVDYSSAGSAKFVKGAPKTESSSSSGSTLFHPRSTAPNMEYFSPGYSSEEHEAHERESLSTGSTLFTPRSTAPNMEYFTPGYSTEAHEANEAHEKTELPHGSTLFTPRSTAANLNYGKEPVMLDEEEERPVKDVFHEEHKPDPSITSLFTPRSTAPNISYGMKESFLDDPIDMTDPDYKEKMNAHTAPVFMKEEPKSEPQPVYEEPSYAAPSYTEQSYSNAGYDNGGYDNTGYDNGGYDNTGYDNGGYDNTGYDNGGYDNTGYSDSGYAQNTSAGSIYQTAGYETSPYQSANYGASEKSEAISGAYGGSRLGSGAYIGESMSRAPKVGRSVGNIGGYVDETSINMSSYGSDPFSGGSLPKLGESGLSGGGLFSIDSMGGFGSNAYEGNTIGGSSYEGNTIGGGSFGGGTFGGSKYHPGETYTAPKSSGSSFEAHSDHPDFGKTFHTGGSGKFDFGMASGDSKRKCPFCKEPIRDDDVFCVACGAELSRPYGSF